MHSTLDVPYIELRVPIAKTEREFLQLAVQAAARKYRLLHQQMGASRATAAQRDCPPWNAGDLPNAPKDLSLPDRPEDSRTERDLEYLEISLAVPSSVV
jgi:hypothetical protein